MPRESLQNVGVYLKNLPSYSEHDVAEHNKRRHRVWVTFRQGVYDVTDYLDEHPGGEDNLMQAAGCSIQPFWDEYPVHFDEDVYKILETMRIGNFVPGIRPTGLIVADNAKVDPFANEPKRDPRMKVVLDRPYNAEAPKDVLANSPITPASLHYVQNHLPVPKIDPVTYRLEIVDESCSTGKSTLLSLAELKSGRWEIRSLPVTLQCGGNKRSFMAAIAPVSGVMWDVGAISTAEWTGVSLVEVLNDYGFDLESENIKHVHFEGLDKDSSGVSFSGSIPKEKLLKDPDVCLLAFCMNGEDLPPDHGYPLRFIIPGCIGSRNIKWLGRIVLSDKECQSHWFKNDYRLLPPYIRNFKDASGDSILQYKSIFESPVQSGICQPVDGDKLDRESTGGFLTVKGWAFSGGGQAIERVMVSLDGGDSWKLAKLNPLTPSAPRYKNWAWTQWELKVALPSKSSFEIVCVATDSSQNSQPETMSAVWNIKGLVNNTWHRIKVELV